MRFLVKMRMPIERGNDAIKNPQFGQKMNELLKELKVEAAYFTLRGGQRGGYLIVNMDDASKMVSIAEPLFLWFNADVEIEPIMLPADLQKGGPDLGAAIQKWG